MYNDIKYLTLDRQTISLSGGESQRIRLASLLDSTLTGVLYIMDEPTVGLHPKDTTGLISVLKDLRDLGNTVLGIEHDVDVMREADYIIDMGPGAGKHSQLTRAADWIIDLGPDGDDKGGKVIAEGTPAEIAKNQNSYTGQYLSL